MRKRRAANMLALGLMGLAAKNWLDSKRVHPPADAEPLDVDGRRIFVIDRGPRDAPPVVLLHGSSGSCWDWEPVIPALEDAYRVVVPERPGMGWSEAVESHRLAPMTETVFRTLRLLGIERPLLVGHSYGGGVAMRMAGDHPGYAAGLLLLASVGPQWTSEGHHMETIIRVRRVLALPLLGPILAWTIAPYLARAVAGEAMMRAQFGPDFELIPSEWIEQAKRIHTRPGILRAGTLENLHSGEDMRELEGRLREIDVPTVVVSAELDRNVPAKVGEALVAAIPGARPVFVSNAAHAFVQARPQEVRRLVDDVMVMVAARA